MTQWRTHAASDHHHMTICWVSVSYQIKPPKLYQKAIKGNSLAVQWLGPSVFTAGAWVQPLVGELRSRKLRSEAKKKTTTTTTKNKSYSNNLPYSNYIFGGGGYTLTKATYDSFSFWKVQ